MIYAIIISIFVGVAVFGFILGLLSGLGKDADRQSQRMDLIKGEGGEKASKETVKFSQRLQNIKSGIRDSKKKRDKKKKKVQPKDKKKENVIEDMLMMVQIDMTSEEFAVIRFVLAVLLMILSFVLCRQLRLDTNNLLLMMVGAGLLGMILPLQWLKNKVKSYQESILLELPEVMDLLAVSVEAGLGFDAALARLYEKNKSILMEELMQATRDIQRGVSKKEAYGDLAKRCKVRELTSFLTAMVQADQMGSSIKSVIKTQSDTLRVSRGRRAAKKAKEAPVKMLLPMVALIFPVIFIVLLGPAILNIMDAL